MHAHASICSVKLKKIDKNMLVRYIKTRYYWNWIEEREINSGHIKQFFNVLHIVQQQYPPHPQILTVFITCSI